MECEYEYIRPVGERNLLKCKRCGFERHSFYSDPKMSRRKCDKPGLGDYIAKGLSAIGIKKKRKCGCNKRQDGWNEVGEKFGL